MATAVVAHAQSKPDFHESEVLHRPSIFEKWCEATESAQASVH